VHYNLIHLQASVNNDRYAAGGVSYAHATVTVEKVGQNGSEPIVKVGEGSDGAVAAVFAAIEKATDYTGEQDWVVDLVQLPVKVVFTPRRGRQPGSQVTVYLLAGPKECRHLYSGQGVDVDIAIAAGKAYLNAINRVRAAILVESRETVAV
jgi:hypothetical protein